MVKVIALISLFVGCAPAGFVGAGSSPNPAPPQNCTVTQNSGSATISCPNGTTATVSNGTNGSQGLGAGIFATQESTACAGLGGVQLITFTDPNNTGVYNASTDTVTSTTLVCNGQTGAVGATGSQGVQGVTGATGSSGQNGTSSSVSVVTATSQECPTGGYDITVTNGNTTSSPYSVCNGAVGETGATGPTGPAGAANITMVQFCSGYTTTYSSSFPEFGQCVNGVLYGTYWDGHNAWTSEIPPGEYMSTSTSAPCDFTVGSNCQISH
jgi:hypothetical protein